MIIDVIDSLAPLVTYDIGPSKTYSKIPPQISCKINENSVSKILQNVKLINPVNVYDNVSWELSNVIELLILQFKNSVHYIKAIAGLFYNVINVTMIGPNK